MCASGTFQSAGLHQKQDSQWGTGECGKSYTRVCEEGRDSKDRRFPGLNFKEVMFKLSNAKQSGQLDKWMRGRGGCSRQREEFGQRREQGAGRLVTRRVGAAECS